MQILKEHFVKASGVEIYAFCLMNNHFHFLVKQLENNGIYNWISKSSNSYSSYSNKVHNRKGHLYQSRYKLVQIHSDEQFIHCARYIHINPYVANLCTLDDLENYKWSSLKTYIRNEQSNLSINKQELFSYFSSIDDMKSFTYDHASYAKSYSDYKDIYL